MFIVLNALEFNIHGVSFIASQNQRFVLVFEETLNVGDGMLRIGFSGILNEHLRVFYRCTYMDGEEKKNMALLKTIDVLLELTALSNMPIIDEKLNGNVKTVYFEESPPLSLLLFCFQKHFECHSLICL
ncbi:hypothetical protein Peur_002476 [Populus x canadensis]